MTSDVDICNLALSHIGDEATVASIDPPEGSAQAEHCQRFFPLARKLLLEAHTWSFAKTRRALVALAETPPGSWGYVYAVPNGCLTPRKVLAPGGSDDDDTQDFVVETLDGARVIYTSVEDAVLLYTVLAIDMSVYSAAAVEALSRLLASYLAGPVIKGKAGIQVAAAQLKIYKDIALPLAIAHDAGGMKKTAGNTYLNFVPSRHRVR